MERLSASRLLIGGLLTLLCAQLLYGALMFSALYKQYQEPELQVSGLLCKDMADHLSLLVRVGKSLRPSTLERALAPYSGRASVEKLVVTDGSDAVLYQSGEGSRTAFTVPATAKALFGEIRSFDTDRDLWTVCPVTDRKSRTVGHVFVALSKSRIVAQVVESGRSLLALFLAITVGEFALLALLVRSIVKRQNGPQERRLSGFAIRIRFMLPLVLGQLLFLVLLISPLNSLYRAELFQTGVQAARQVTWDLGRLAGMGLPVNGIHTLDSWLMERQKHIHALGMAVYDANGRFHAAASPTGALDEAAWTAVRNDAVLARSDIRHPSYGAPVGAVFAAMDPHAALRNLFSVMLDNITVTVIVTLFLGELLYLLLMRGSLSTMAATPDFMRPVIFACLFATEMSMSYVPIRIGELGLDLFGLPHDLVSGLPISCELFMAGAAMFIGGFWSQRSGWRPMLFSGLLLCLAGSVLSWLSSGPLPFILSRGFCGLGYGFINLAAQVFVISHSSESSRARDLAFMFAGLYAGTLCGSAMGGLIADRLGYEAVFPASALLLLLLPFLLWKLLPREPWIVTRSADRLSLRETAAFFRDRRMSALLLFFIIPNALITVCLFQFFVPLSLSQSGTSPATIGRVFLVYCVIVMFAGPYFGSLIDRARTMVKPLFLSQLIAALSVLALVFLDGVLGAMLCVTLLAMNTAIASNGQGAYALSLPAAERFGRSRTMGFYNVAMRLGQVFGPLSLGLLMTAWDAKTGLSILAAFTGVCALLFVLLSLVERHTGDVRHA